MHLLTTAGWEDYALLDSGNGKRLEQFGKYRLVRPDPQIIWEPRLSEKEWGSADAVFEIAGKGVLRQAQDNKGTWKKRVGMSDEWEVRYNDLTFMARLSPFKHTGIFPEQSLQWEWMTRVIASKAKQSSLNGKEIATSSASWRTPRNDKFKVLNLFAYTGGASLIAAAAGAEVTHVDASKPAISWAKENQRASHLEDKPIRWILDDAIAFVEREIRRGNTYDGIIMDPPVFGHGPHGERWEFYESFPKLLRLCEQVLSKNTLFFIVNAYAISASSVMLQNILEDVLKHRGGFVESGELALEEKTHHRLLSTGIFARWNPR